MALFEFYQFGFFTLPIRTASVVFNRTRNVGVTSVLRLSIIVPHLDDSQNLESTLLSLLENRPSHSEIIVVHNGNYNDPYELADDEVLLLEAPKSYGTSEQLNLALSNARSGAVQVLFPGITVEANWFAEGLELLDDQVACVGVPCQLSGSKQVVWGLERASLPHRRAATHGSDKVVPSLCGSFFHRPTLELIGGFCPGASREAAEIEIQLLLAAMDLRSTIASEATLRGSARSLHGLEIGYELGRVCGQVACAYGTVEGSGVEVDSLAKQLGHLAGGLMSPKTVAERLGWVMGVRDRSLEAAVRSRLVEAAERLDEATSHQQLAAESFTLRRAA